MESDSNTPATRSLLTSATLLNPSLLHYDAVHPLLDSKERRYLPFGILLFPKHPREGLIERARTLGSALCLLVYFATRSMS